MLCWCMLVSPPNKMEKLSVLVLATLLGAITCQTAQQTVCLVQAFASQAVAIHDDCTDSDSSVSVEARSWKIDE